MNIIIILIIILVLIVLYTKNNKEGFFVYSQWPSVPYYPNLWGTHSYWYPSFYPNQVYYPFSHPWRVKARKRKYIRRRKY